MKTLTIKELKEALDRASGGDDNREVGVKIDTELECEGCNERQEFHDFAWAIDVESNNPNSVFIMLS